MLSANTGTTALTTTSFVEAVRPHSPGSSPAAQVSGTLLGLICAALDDAKAEEIVTLDLAGQSALADHMVIATGRSDRHVNAIAERVTASIRDGRRVTPKVEGQNAGEWVLIDAGDVIVHVFKPDARAFYNLERLWGADRPREKRPD